MIRQLGPQEIDEFFLLIGAADYVGNPASARIDGAVDAVLRRLLCGTENSAVLVLRLRFRMLLFRRFRVDGIQPHGLHGMGGQLAPVRQNQSGELYLDRKSTRLNSSHLVISYAVFCL